MSLTHEAAIHFLESKAARHDVKIEIIETRGNIRFGVQCVDIDFVAMGFEDEVSVWQDANGTLGFGNGSPWL